MIVTKWIFGNANIKIRSLLIESVLGVALRLEQMAGIEPVFSAWEAEALTIVRHLHSGVFAYALFYHFFSNLSNRRQMIK